MAKKDGWSSTYTMTGLLDLENGFIKIEREDDEPLVVIADDIERFEGKTVTITVVCEEPK